MHQNRPEEAETSFLKRVAHDEGDAHAWQFLGELAVQRKQFELAQERFTRALDLNRNDPDVWRPLATAFLEQGDAERALTCLEHLAEHLRHMPEAWESFFAAFQAAGQAQPFLERLEGYLEQGWVAPRHWTKLAELYAAAGMVEKSQACLARIEGEGAAPSLSDLAMARYHLRGDEAEAALRYVERLGDSQQDNPEYWLVKGETHYLLSAYGDAQASYERALALGELDFRAWFHLGNIHFRAGQLEQARHAFAEAVECDMQQAKGWYNLGLAEDALKQDAFRSFERANHLDRRFAPAWNALGVLHFQRGDDRAARRCFLRGLAVSRESLLGWANLGAVYRRMRRTADAERCERKVLRLGGEVEPDGGEPVRLFYDRDPHG